jgi:hypothetical protein
MDRQHAELWQRIRDFAIDAPGTTLSFADRLARENNWSRPFARRVVEQYRRFVFLAMVADHEVTPSDEVDEAWHLHLTYTQSYWNDLCRGVLGRPLHHVPTRGGANERSRHFEQYERTLATYAQWFEEPPPNDIWPPANVRFAKNSRHVRVNCQRAWILPKPNWIWRLAGRGSLLAGALAAPLMLGAANPMDLSGPEFLVFYAVVCAVAIAAAIALRSFLRSDSPANDDKLCCGRAWLRW